MLPAAPQRQLYTEPAELRLQDPPSCPSATHAAAGSRYLTALELHMHVLGGSLEVSMRWRSCRQLQHRHPHHRCARASAAPPPPHPDRRVAAARQAPPQPPLRPFNHARPLPPPPRVPDVRYVPQHRPRGRPLPPVPQPPEVHTPEAAALTISRCVFQCRRQQSRGRACSRMRSPASHCRVSSATFTSPPGHGCSSASTRRPSLPLCPSAGCTSACAALRPGTRRVGQASHHLNKPGLREMRLWMVGLPCDRELGAAAAELAPAALRLAKTGPLVLQIRHVVQELMFVSIRWVYVALGATRVSATFPVFRSISRCAAVPWWPQDLARPPNALGVRMLERACCVLKGRSCLRSSERQVAPKEPRARHEWDHHPRKPPCLHAGHDSGCAGISTHSHTCIDPYPHTCRWVRG